MVILHLKVERKGSKGWGGGRSLEMLLFMAPTTGKVSLHEAAVGYYARSSVVNLAGTPPPPPPPCSCSLRLETTFPSISWSAQFHDSTSYLKQISKVKASFSQEVTGLRCLVFSDAAALQTFTSAPTSQS